MVAPRKKITRTIAPEVVPESQTPMKAPRPVVVSGVVAKPVNYPMIYRREPEGGYTVTCPALPGVTTYGRTKAEARTMARDAVKLYLEELIENGEPIPGPKFQIESLLVEVKLG
jgi:antitoxin HicB